MRISMAIVSCAATATLLFGCSNMWQDRQVLPVSDAASPLVRIAGLPLTAASTRPGPVARAAFLSRIARAGHDAGAVRVWLANVSFNYLIGLDQSGKAVDAIDVGANGCIGPASVKIDRLRNIWVGCESESSKRLPDGASEQEYSRAGSLLQTYTWTAPCPKVASECQAFGSGDGGPDNRGHVFATAAGPGILVHGIQKNLDSGFFWWRAGDPGGNPTFISLGKWCEPICLPVYMDTDKSGNLWFTYIGIIGGREGFGLGEVASPTTKPQIVTIFAPDPYDQVNGVVTSNGGKVLNVVNTTKREIDRYKLPVTPASKPLKTLGPTLSGDGGLGFPVAGGFNKDETKLAIGDQGGWLDVGTVASNRWKAVLNLQFFPNVDSAAYTPSDK